MRPVLCLLIVSALGLSTANAQTSTADGVQALIRGDYQSAARILQPLAKNVSQPDPLAQFFMAILYDSGRGVDPDSMRACGLFQNAAKPANPFMYQSQLLAEAMLEPLPAIARELCSADAWTVGPAASITLGQNYSVGLLAGSVVAGARTTSAAGIDAYPRKDYDAAAEILRPIAERTDRPDHAAEFFMASLYESGRGVAVDLVRSCALYQRSADPAGPFGAPARALWGAIRKRLTSDQEQDCLSLARVGLNHGFQPVTFMLEPEQSIAWTISGATVTYRGKDKHIDVGLELWGSRFLPIRHTELAVDSSPSTRRHFMEVFRWVPTDAGRWMLLWELFEVIRDDLRRIAGEPLETLAAEEPPTGSWADVRELVSLRVTDAGDAELAILGGSHRRTVLIETDAERLGATARDAARRAADRRVDWNADRDVRRPPSLAYADVRGCRGVFVYGWSEDRMEATTVFAHRDGLQLSTRAQTLDALNQPDLLEVQIHVYARPVLNSPFCTDVGSQMPSEEIWRVRGGRVTISLSPVAARVPTPATDTATIRIDGAVLVNSAGTRVSQASPITLITVLGRD
jgi:hypothetical protein